MKPLTEERAKRGLSPLLLVTSLGVVFGDLGTSPLYTMQTVFESLGSTDLETTVGVLSLVWWTLFLSVTFKYCALVMRADKHGEGGILVLMSLLRPAENHPWLVAAGLFGAALIYGDGVITPAISVLSALEGLNQLTTRFEPYTKGAAVAVLLALFAMQMLGTAKIGRVFGPIMFLWFLVIGAIGFGALLAEPQVLRAADPTRGVALLLRVGWLKGGKILGGVFLCTTGAEALYADMGHVGRANIRLSWACVALPALLLNYAGQAAALARNGSGTSISYAASNPFFLLLPPWAIIPMVVLSTAATVIASQSIITGAFSVSRQAVQLGWLPGLAIRQTSAEQYGQIYVPTVNWMMMVATIGVTLSFGSSHRLAGAFGSAVSTTMLLTSCLVFNVMRNEWKWNVFLSILIFSVLISVDTLFFAANTLKILKGGWVPLILAALIYLIMTIWKAGTDALQDQTISFVDTNSPSSLDSLTLPRVPGTAVFLTRSATPMPIVLLRHLEDFKALQAKVVTLTVYFLETPRLGDKERVHVQQISDAFYHVTVHYGFFEPPDLVAALNLAIQQGVDIPIDLTDVVIFASRSEIIRGQKEMKHAMYAWRQGVFSFLFRNSTHVVDRFDESASLLRYAEIRRIVRL